MVTATNAPGPLAVTPATHSELPVPVSPAVIAAVSEGLSASQKSLPAWLFYDAKGSRLFEQITALPEYYLTRTERDLFAAHANDIVETALVSYQKYGPPGSHARLRLMELGAGSAAKTGILLRATVASQGATQYLPIDVSDSALDEACRSIGQSLADVEVRPQVANYVTDPLDIPAYAGPTLALYIGSSIGNFSRDEAVSILANLRSQLHAGDTLLLGTDLVKDEATLLAAYNDAQGVTAAFNRNVLERLNRDLGADFDLSAFRHQAIWNAEDSRIEMHLRSTRAQVVSVPTASMRIHFAEGETIHTENSYKFTDGSLQSLLSAAGFSPVKSWKDSREWFVVTLAKVM